MYTLEATEKEVQDTSCRGSGGVPQLKNIPQDWGIRGLIKTVSTVLENCLSDSSTSTEQDHMENLLADRYKI